MGALATNKTLDSKVQLCAGHKIIQQPPHFYEYTQYTPTNTTYRRVKRPKFWKSRKLNIPGVPYVLGGKVRSQVSQNVCHEPTKS